MKRARATGVAFSLLSVLSVLAAGCAPDVDLGTLKVRPWQPEVLADGAGDLLDDAERIDVTVIVDGEAETFPLEDSLRAADLRGGPEGSVVEVELRTAGATLSDALGRTGARSLAPGDEGVEATALLAPPDVEHRLFATLPDARLESTVCQDREGTAFVIGGRQGGTLAPGSFVLDFEARSLAEGSGLSARRVNGACAVDDDGAVWLAGGCSTAGTATGTLLKSSDGRDGSYTDVTRVPGAGCDAGLAVTDDGRLLGFTGAELFLYEGATGDLQRMPLPTARHGARFALGKRSDPYKVVLVGGFSDEARTTPHSDTLVVTVKGEAIDNVRAGALVPAAVAVARDGRVLAASARDLVRIDGDAARELVREGAIPAGFSPAALVDLGAERFGLLSTDGGRLAVSGPDGTTELVVDPPRPGGALLSEPGGALLLIGGGRAGVSLFVVE